ncbi:PstS family phosphate ABC transporter substrate-binding protein [Dongia deserti]|uniref:PstS family phosphate ABC transporter substrate-binding protein n=1 Tax=Dongia deserti TaxID=2268030 RepID=UPI000E64637A|nr:PstS family phosphate ABC transporter substrate-binding protein [Dongia deserti]
MKRMSVAIAALAGLAITAGAAEARDQIHIVGSSTVFPFTTAVAENFGKAGKFKTPVVESTGTGGGMKLFCAGVGENTPDVTGASRKIKDSEIEGCKKNGVTSITEVLIGYDGIAFANSKAGTSIDVTRKQLWQALAKQVPVNGKLADNPYKMWNEIDPSLPAQKIEVLGPPPTSGTRDAFVELVMDVGCEEFPEIEALDKDAKKAACQSIREDGAFIEAGENDNLIVQKLDANHNAFGVFGYSFLEENADKLQGGKIEGVAPTFDTIADKSYPVSREIYFYVKNAHVGVIPGIREFVAEYVSERAMGEEGYLADKGLITLTDDKYKDVASKAMALSPMN